MSVPSRVARPPERPLMIYDGDCDFCTRWIARWRRVTGPRVDYAPSGEVASRFPEIPESSFEEAVQLIETDGRVSAGAEAAARSLACGGGARWPLWVYERVPGAGHLADAAYRWIARRRHCRAAARKTSNIEL